MDEHKQRVIFDRIRRNDDVREALISWLKQKCRELKNPDLWEEFKDGEGKVNAAKELEKLIRELSKKESIQQNKTNFL